MPTWRLLWRTPIAGLATTAVLLAGCSGVGDMTIGDADGTADSAGTTDGAGDADGTTDGAAATDGATGDADATAASSGPSKSELCTALGQIGLGPAFGPAVTFAEVGETPFACEATMETPYGAQLVASVGDPSELLTMEDVEAGLVPEENLEILDGLGDQASLARTNGGARTLVGVVVDGTYVRVSLNLIEEHDELPQSAIEDGLVQIMGELLGLLGLG